MTIRNNPESGGRRRWIALASTVAIAAAMAGCGNPDTVDATRMSFYPVKGKVLLPDGKPLASAGVVFAGPVTSTAITESDGTFTFKGTKDGLPAGDYKVRLEAGESKATLRNQTLPFSSRYLDEDASDLKATVKPEGPNDFELKLTKGDDGARKSAGGSRPGR